MRKRWCNQKRVWTTKDGNDIPVRKMSDTHLMNSYKMLFNKGLSRDVHIEFGWLEDEIYRRKLDKPKVDNIIRARRGNVRVDAEIWASCQPEVDWN